jgi:hypothetical protein
MAGEAEGKVARACVVEFGDQDARHLRAKSASGLDRSIERALIEDNDQNIAVENLLSHRGERSLEESATVERRDDDGDTLGHIRDSD